MPNLSHTPSLPHEGGGRRAAIFDLDGTVLNGSSERLFFRYLLDKRAVRLRDVARWLWGVGSLLPYGARTALRGNRFYLAERAAAEVISLAETCFQERMEERISPIAVQRIEEHRSRGDALILLSGSLTILAEPFGRRLGIETVVASDLEVRDGRLTGRMSSRHPIGGNKRILAESLAQCFGFDLRETTAYANGGSDIPLLKCVGHPVAVSPEPALARLAKQFGWLQEEWHGMGGGFGI